ncbi:MAG: nucleotidyltransferase domain-containing protein [Solirubrobacterales bacterium]|jgi:predicted nucleotidyltransferase|nr:nucleotidyltransferase domain-containing protein [Solirubrobacterales bacterium]
MPGSAWPAEVLARRRGERDVLLSTARAYVDALAGTLDLVGAAVIGSVARGDFNVWSDIDVLVVAHDLPPRYLDRAALLTSAPAPRVQAFAFTPKELAEAQARRDPRAIELLESGVFLAGERDVRALLRA